MLKAEKLGRRKSWLDGRIAGGQLSGSMTCPSKSVMLQSGHFCLNRPSEENERLYASGSLNLHYGTAWISQITATRFNKAVPAGPKVFMRSLIVAPMTASHA